MGIRARRLRRVTVLLGLPVAVMIAGTGASAAFGGSTPQPVNPAVEAQNYAKTTERQAIYLTPQYQAQLRAVGTQNTAAAVAAQAADQERAFTTDLCWNGNDGCAGDVRLYNWQAHGYGIVSKVLFTARNGATLSGHVWATKAGPAKRPAIVITNGSVQADEQLYWFAAQALAKAGYVVLTFDPQGQGQSDTQGQSPDQSEGTPSQTDGRPFFDGTEDALNFFLSSPTKKYTPVPSCSSGTSHAPKQSRRTAAGLNTAYNPNWSLIDSSRVGLAGHSYGASGVSYIAQWDPRVKAVVAWDNLALPNPNAPLGVGSIPGEQGCPANPHARTVPPISKPGLGLSADYFLPPTPNATVPDPTAKEATSLAYSRAGVPSGELVIRGGTHFDFDWIPNPAFGATLRGADEIAWYTTAWFDKYVKGDPSADARLLTDRWRRDGQEAAVDPKGDGNMFSSYYRSRLDFRTGDGQQVDCENLRAGCKALSNQDGYAGSYDYLSIDTAPDGQHTSRVPTGTRLR